MAFCCGARASAAPTSEISAVQSDGFPIEPQVEHQAVEGGPEPHPHPPGDGSEHVGRRSGDQIQEKRRSDREREDVAWRKARKTLRKPAMLQSSWELATHEGER